MIQTVIYLTPIIALIALLWANRSWLKNLFSTKKVAVETVKISEYDNVMQKQAVQYARNLRTPNHGNKQKESIFRNNGKTIANSETYKSTHKRVFEL